MDRWSDARPCRSLGGRSRLPVRGGGLAADGRWCCRRRHYAGSVHFYGHPGAGDTPEMAVARRGLTSLHEHLSARAGQIAEAIEHMAPFVYGPKVEDTSAPQPAAAKRWRAS